MSGRHQPVAGADSIAGLDIACPICDATYTVYEDHDCAPHVPDHSLYEFRTAHILSWIDRRLAGIESDLGDDETMQSLGLHGRVKLHERRATLQDVRAELERAS